MILALDIGSSSARATLYEDGGAPVPDGSRQVEYHARVTADGGVEHDAQRLLEAATDMGASRLQAMRKITLPLAAPGIVAAFLLVFIPSIGEYVTPSLVGGNNGYMFGQAIASQFVGGALISTSAP